MTHEQAIKSAANSFIAEIDRTRIGTPMHATDGGVMVPLILGSTVFYAHVTVDEIENYADDLELL